MISKKSWESRISAYCGTDTNDNFFLLKNLRLLILTPCKFVEGKVV